MINRKIEGDILRFCKSGGKGALLITGCRQVGKTYIVRKVAREQFENFVELNFLEDKRARDLFENAKDSAEFLLGLSALVGASLVPGKTLIFFDEVQECKEIVTASKFLVEEGSYKYILSGSLLGVHLKDVKSIPVGYLEYLQMYPMDFEEFIRAQGVAGRVIDSLQNCFETSTAIQSTVHDKMMDLFYLYLIVGGMPAVVQRYLDTKNLMDVYREQRNIINLLKKDISHYDPANKLYLEEIFELIPSELKSQNKRFKFKSLGTNFKLSRNENSFLWLRDAGVAHAVYCCDEPKSPLVLSKSRNLFKLFMADVGLLASMYSQDIQLKILQKQAGINFGSIFENFAAQELKAHGFDIYYYNNKNSGELDFLVEQQGTALPIEIKSGKSYNRHSALNKVMAHEKYGINSAYVFCNNNIEQKGGIKYMPIYTLMFLQKQDLPESLLYSLDLGELI